MFARMTAKAIFVASAIALAFFGIGFLGLALCTALDRLLGISGSYALVGVIFVVPPLVWALVTITRPRPAKEAADSGSGKIARALLAAVAKETPWVAIIGAGMAGAAEMFLNRRKTRK